MPREEIEDMMQSDVRHFSAPLGDVTAGRLEFRRGAVRVTMDSDATMSHLYQARFEGPAPEVGVQAGTVTIWQQKRLLDWSGRTAHLTLNATVPWDLDFHDGLAHLTADLSGLQLRLFQISGGASHVDLTLGRPTGTVRISMDGGTSDLSVHRPAGVVARVAVKGGVAGLVLDDQHFGAIDSAQLVGGAFDQSTDRYLIEVRGGARNLRVDSQGA
jgi:hypothetical protein